MAPTEGESDLPRDGEENEAMQPLVADVFDWKDLFCLILENDFIVTRVIWFFLICNEIKVRMVLLWTIFVYIKRYLWLISYILFR